MENNSVNSPETPGTGVAHQGGFRAYLPALLWAITLLLAVLWFSGFGNAVLWWAGGSVVLGLSMGAVFGRSRGTFRKASFYATLGAAILSGILLVMFLSREWPPFLSFHWRDLDFSDPRWIRIDPFALFGAGLVGAASGGAVGAGMPGTFRRAIGMGLLFGLLAAVIGMAGVSFSHVFHEQGHGLAVFVNMIAFPIYVSIGGIAGLLIGVLCEVLGRIRVLFTRPLLVLAFFWLLLLVLGVILAPYQQLARESEVAHELEQLGGMVHRADGHLEAVAWTEEQMAVLARLSNLEELLYGGPAEGLTYLKNFPNLKILRLVRSPWLTDSHLAHVEGLTALERFEIKNSGIGVKSVSELNALEKQYGPDLHRCPNVTDAGVAHLAGLRKLRHLNLSSTQLTDKGLAHLSGLLELEELVLEDTPITDTGLVHLKGLGRLRNLILYRTAVTEEGVKSLQQSIPGIKVTYQ